MASTPGRPRTSGIPTPGKTGGRLRSFSSSASRQSSPQLADQSILDSSFMDAIKSNDPSRYTPRTVSHGSSISRPPSVASGSRPKTPSAGLKKSTHQRPESRQSDVFSRTQTQRLYDVGDNVRIESLGFEGTLRFLGEIDGKQGQWAGVELSGGFVGKGKNNGTVDGKRYFNCPPKCGVFVALSKLSPPTVGPGAYSRPSSVASARASMGGRVTPSLNNGRITPNLFNGRVTPVRQNGRVTPSSSFGFATPSAKPGTVKQRLSQTPVQPRFDDASTSAMSKITAGSRASKYVGMTAQQLSAKRNTPGKPGALALAPGSPSRSAGSISPIRNLDSPIHGGTSSPASNTPLTPKALPRLSGVGTPKSFGQGRPSLATPKARIPSAVAMPPPPSPSGSSRKSSGGQNKPATPTFSSASNDTAVDDDLDAITSSFQLSGGAGEQSMLAKLRSHSRGVPIKDEYLADDKDDTVSPSRQDLLDVYEHENARLKGELEDSLRTLAHLRSAESERDEARSRVEELEGKHSAYERSLKERGTRVEALENDLRASKTQLEEAKTDGAKRVENLQAKVAECETLISSLKTSIEAKSTEAGQFDDVLHEKDASIARLEAHAQAVQAEFTSVREVLSSQVEELRNAGQETIELYEEKLATADAQRFKLEDLVDDLNEKLRRRTGPTSPRASDSRAEADAILDEAAQIDFETLRDQNVHLQQTIAALEDELEAARVANAKDESAASSRIKQYRDAEGAARAEVAEMKREVERLMKSEGGAKLRVEEIEEALRENTLALENARAEVEGLTAELASLEGKAAGAKAVDGTHRSSAQHRDEIMQLKEELATTREGFEEALLELDASKADADALLRNLTDLRETMETLDSHKAELEHICAELTAKLENEQIIADELRRSLDQKSNELELARKHQNRDRPVTIVGTEPVSPTSSKHDKDEIKGLKHIIQELQKENVAVSHKLKLTESENKMLLSDTNKLREEMNRLEENIEESILREGEELELMDGNDSTSHGSSTLYTRSKPDPELEQLRKKLADVEMTTARTIHDLNKELSELELLVEAKIYKEDELEREIERLKQKLARRSSKSSSELVLPDQPRTKKPSPRNSTAASETAEASDEVCEVCERPGHDILNCPLLKDGASSDPAPVASSSSGPSQLYCRDCESYGHLPADCPHFLDVF